MSLEYFPIDEGDLAPRYEEEKKLLDSIGQQIESVLADPTEDNLYEEISQALQRSRKINARMP